MQYIVKHREFSDLHGRFNVQTISAHGPSIRLGYLNWTIEDGVMHIDDLFINEAHRQYGIGSDLVETLLNLADLKGVHEVWGLADRDNARLRKFYEQFGFHFDEAPNNHGQLPFRLHFVDADES